MSIPFQAIAGERWAQPLDLSMTFDFNELEGLVPEWLALRRRAERPMLRLDFPGAKPRPGLRVVLGGGAHNPCWKRRVRSAARIMPPPFPMLIRTAWLNDGHLLMGFTHHTRCIA